MLTGSYSNARYSKYEMIRLIIECWRLLSHDHKNDVNKFMLCIEKKIKSEFEEISKWYILAAREYEKG